MNSRNDQIIEQNLEFPTRNILSGIFGPAPVQTGIYGDLSLPGYVVWVNHKPSLAQVPVQLGQTAVSVMALDGGGFSVGSATALNLIKMDDLLGMCRAVTSNNNGLPVNEIWIPQMICNQFHLAEGDMIEGIKVRLGCNNLIQLIHQASGSEIKVGNDPLPPWIRRIITSLGVSTGQFLLFLIPLFIFGWTTLLIGVFTIAFLAILLAIFWKILPGNGWLRGLVCGIVAGSGIAVFLLTGLAWTLTSALLLGAAAIIIGTWMGGILMGFRPIQNS